MIYSGDIDPLPVPMIPPDPSWVSPKRMSVSTFNQGRTLKPSVSPLGPSKQQQLSLYRAFLTPFPHQDSAPDEVTPPSESTHGRGNHDKETENLIASTAQRISKGKIQSPSPTAAEVEGKIVIASASGRAIELYGDKKEAGEEG